MRSPPHDNSAPRIIDRQTLESLGVLIPVRLNPVKVTPGRHPLGRPGDGMRMLRTRPYVAGEDNPRDIDKFSPRNAPDVVEWEDEAQASMILLADVSASMAISQKASLRNASLFQLTYSLWRAGDRVCVEFFDSEHRGQVRAANLKTQMSQLTSALSKTRKARTTELRRVLMQYANRPNIAHSGLLFVISDFVESSDTDIDLAAVWQPILNKLQRNMVPVIITFRLSKNMRGLLKLWDAERRQRRLTWFSRKRICHVNKQEEMRVAKLVSFFRSVGLDCMVIGKQREVYPQLAQLARTRRQRKN